MKKRSDFSRLMGYAGGHRVFTYASLVLSAVSALMALIPFLYIWMILRDVLNAAPNYAQAVNIPHYGWMAVLFAVLSYLIYIAALMCSHLSAFRVATNLRLAVSEHLAVLPLGFAETFGSGKLRKIIHESTGAAETYLAHQLPDQYNAIATPVGLLVLLLAFDWRLGLLSLAPVVLAFLIMTTMTGKRMAEKMRQYGNALEAMSNEAVEYVRGIPVVKTFGQSVFSFKKFKAAIDEYEKWVVSYTKDLRLPMMFYTAAVNGVFAFLIAGGLLFTTHGVTPEFLLNLLFYIIITPVISLTLTRIMYMSENKMVVADALARIDSVLETAPMQVQAVPQYPKDSAVTLRDVHFSYDGKTEVIKGVSLDIQPGQTVAFVGPSGGGKSTLANLVCRFFDVQSGSVRVGGADVRAIPKEELMDTISFVFQNSRLLKGSILDNVRLGRAQATEAEVLAVLKAAQCMDIVEKFPAGIHTVIGTKGVYLSGGEQQRIAIARAMLRNAPILLLDEATAFADPDNEAKVQAAFAQLAKGKTVLMIAHRLSTVANADCIYVVQDGQIVESGTKDELCALNGLFARMWQEYQASVQWKVASNADVYTSARFALQNACWKIPNPFRSVPCRCRLGIFLRSVYGFNQSNSRSSKPVTVSNRRVRTSIISLMSSAGRQSAPAIRRMALTSAAVSNSQRQRKRNNAAYACSAGQGMNCGARSKYCTRTAQYHWRSAGESPAEASSRASAIRAEKSSRNASRASWSK